MKSINQFKKIINSRFKNPKWIFGYSFIAFICGVLFGLSLKIQPLNKLEYNSESIQDLSKYDRSYLTELQTLLDIPNKNPNELKMRDLIVMMANLNVRLNKYENLGELKNNRQRPVYPKNISIPLNKEEVVVYLPRIEDYTFEIINTGKESLAGPILYQNYLWRNAETIIASAGFREIEDEIERAKAIWSFVYENIFTSFPVTEGLEEHDLVRYLVCYGQGWCDDAALNYSKLAQLVGLRGRFWGLDGHVTAEAFANGKWRMLDPNLGHFFHAKGDQNEIYGVEELALNPQYFDHYVTHPKIHRKSDNASKPSDFAYLYLTAENNKSYGPENATANHDMTYYLRPDEKIIFTNVNYGRYWLGRFPSQYGPVNNGYFQTKLNSSTFEVFEGQAKLINNQKGGFEIINETNKPAVAGIRIISPFPLIGGSVSFDLLSDQEGLNVIIKDNENDHQYTYHNSSSTNILLDTFFSIVAPHPTYNYSIGVQVNPGDQVLLEKLMIFTDFQFTDLALVKLKSGRNKFKIDSPIENPDSSFKATLYYR
jgi:hypothetical protein